ncbi:MAG TPA: RsmB/NOP family class I SAM-dependent RNA methyltransferase [Alphaproteobacteria bacterium]|nr:RsmB/NOP family class I SAM-dependent RNA methyltransferase [Alphaproteobacteria bacterium]
MRLPGRLSAAIEVLTDIEQRHRPVSEALKAWGLDNRFAGSGDRAAIGNLVYDALRRRASHAFAMGRDTPRALVLSVAVRDWGERPDALAAAFVDDPHAPETMSADEVARLSEPEPLAEAPDNVRADLPEWIAAMVPATLGEDWVAEGQAMACRPPLDLRVNTLKATRPRAMQALARFHPEEAHAAPDGIRIPAGTRDSRTPNVQADEAFLKGWIEVQDFGSQIAALLVGATAGEQVLDLCAGAGGKTLAMAAAMGNRGQIFAHDSDRHRLAPIYDRLKRAGVRNVQVRPPAGGALDDLAGRMDRVVIDAPCTGSGTWRRRPDAKWKLTPEQLAARVSEQRAILEDGQRYVKPGGLMAYITCSILPDENGRQVAAFVAAHPEFTIVPGAGLWQQVIGERARVRGLPEGGLQLTPGTTGTDGFYFAALRRTG